MPEVNLNKKITLDVVAQQANLDTPQDTQEQKKELPPLLSRTPNLTVSNAPMDLEALVNKLNLETADTKETTAKKTLQSTFTTVIAKAKERGMVSARNLELLEQAENYSQQLDSTTAAIDTLTTQVSQLEGIVNASEKEVSQKQSQVDSLSKELENLQAKMQQESSEITILQMEIDSLTKQIENEVDAQKETNLKKRLANEQAKLEQAKKDLDGIQDKKDATQAMLEKARTKLETANENLAAAKGTLSDAKNVLSAANAAKAELNQKIQQALSEITDETIIRDIADALKIDASDVTSINKDDKAERSEEEEKYLEMHSSVQVFQDTLSAHYQDILDTIAAKRENIV